SEQNGHDRRGQGGDGAHRVKVQGVAVHVWCARQDDRVQDHDVGHRHECDHAAADLSGDIRAACADLEVPVDGVLRFGCARFWPRGCCCHGGTSVEDVIVSPGSCAC